MSQPELELEDIQGNVLAGFNTDIQVFVALTLVKGEERSAAQWVGKLAGAVTTVKEVRDGRKAMRSLAAGSAEPWLAVAVSPRLITAARPTVKLNDIAFQLGMIRRASSALGDETDSSQWRVGSTSAPVDVLVIVASNDEAAAAARADALIEDASRVGLACSYRETGRRLEGDREHFGFRDGLSQPRIFDCHDDPDTYPGDVVFGYPRGPNGTPFTNPDDEIGLTCNGSLLVFRRLAQDVAAFHAFCKCEAERLAPQWPGLSGEHLAALIVGRWPSGAPATASVSKDPGMPDNKFDFLDDREGKGCPFGAHIRKVNPRSGPRDRKDVPRILRRGIPFGAPLAGASDTERGLLFVAYQTSIKDKFEFLSGSWMNETDLPVSGAGLDLLVGRNPSSQCFEVEGPNGRVKVTREGPGWITPTGGAYLFAPGRRGLAMLCGPSASVA